MTRHWSLASGSDSPEEERRVRGEGRGGRRAGEIGDGMRKNK